MSEPFISVADLEIFMDTPPLDGPRASLAVAAAMRAVRKYLDQEITFVASDSVDLDGAGKDTIRLPERPVIEVESVLEDDDALDAADYLVRNSSIIRKDGGTFILGRGNITVVYSHGWCVEDVTDADFSSDGSDATSDACETVPADIILATLSAARRAYNSFGADDVIGNTKSETIGNYSYSLSDAETASGVRLIKAERAVLDAYRVPSARNTGTR